MKMKVLILTGYYEPSVKGGGPIRSIKNLVDNLSDKIDFYIVTSDRDLGDKKPFVNIITDKWVSVGNAKVYYTNPLKVGFKKMANLINSIDYNVIYLNSFFSFKFSIIPVILWNLKMIKRKSIVIAPRGEFSAGALGLKSKKKKLYICIAKVLRLYDKFIWHATSDNEKRDILTVIGNEAEIKIAKNLSPNYQKLNYNKNIDKKKGELKIVFISRIHPKKNLKSALKFLTKVDGKVEFNIYGPLEDNNYWLECKDIIKKLPSNVNVSYKGMVNNNKVIEIFNKHHIFLFPTLGENYGHVISEALIGGCPVIISDQTPWRNLERKQVGWDINLNYEKEFTKAIQKCIDLDETNYKILSRNAFNYGKLMANNDKHIIDTIGLFK